METANEFIVRFIDGLEDRKRSAQGVCLALTNDAPTPQARMMSVIRNELCPSDRCNDVDRAILGASVGG